MTCRQGTPFYRTKPQEAAIILVLTLLAYGCPLQAVVQALGFNARTLKAWQDKAGAPCQQVHNALVTQQARHLQQVQADEVRVRLQKRRVVWMARA